jgi:hypothetical protein
VCSHKGLIDRNFSERSVLAFQAVFFPGQIGFTFFTSVFYLITPVVTKIP